MKILILVLSFLYSSPLWSCAQSESQLSYGDKFSSNMIICSDEIDEHEFIFEYSGDRKQELIVSDYDFMCAEGDAAVELDWLAYKENGMIDWQERVEFERNFTAHLGLKQAMRVRIAKDSQCAFFYFRFLVMPSQSLAWAPN